MAVLDGAGRVLCLHLHNPGKGAAPRRPPRTREGKCDAILISVALGNTRHACVSVACPDVAARTTVLLSVSPGLSWQAPLANWQFRAAIQELKAYVQARFDAVGAAAAGAAGGASLAAARGTCRVLYRPIHLWTCAVVAPCHANPFELKARLDALVAVAATLAGAPKSNPTSTQLLR